jgi:hypothetical protein
VSSRASPPPQAARGWSHPLCRPCKIQSCCRLIRVWFRGLVAAFQTLDVTVNPLPRWRRRWSTHCCWTLQLPRLRALWIVSCSWQPSLYLGIVLVSGYCSTRGRTSKPFNPLEKETYEFVSPENGFRMVEKVRHFSAM